MVTSYIHIQTIYVNGLPVSLQALGRGKLLATLIALVAEAAVGRVEVLPLLRHLLKPPRTQTAAVSAR